MIEFGQTDTPRGTWGHQRDYVTAVGRITEDINKAEDAGTAHGHIDSTDALQ